ncbi:response regulator [Azospirillum doebereinerae]|uniref:response regulator n=1 Tax=Azospirillum doebereinerae TaxID=92933 RepID=UPI001EE60D8A|nr:response regulator [Azospirillum doebereinerae]MCG5240559.1 response regulator [Azospirillum doebereinerae]
MPVTSSHIIIADDEDLVATSLAILLRDLGHRVTVTHDGREALDADEADPANLLITDVRMPGMDGLTLVRMIQDRRPEIPAIVITGYGNTVPVNKIKPLIILQKPIHDDAMALAVATFLSSS